MKIDYSKIELFADRAMLEAVHRYIEQGRKPGDFLTAFISNDLFGALGKADDNNRARIWDWCVWFYNEAPGGCYGSPEKMAAWSAERKAASQD